MAKDPASLVSSTWPELPPLEAWQETCTTLHMWSQVIGKIRLMLSPDINHSSGSTLYVTTRGLTTSSIPFVAFTFAIDFDFIAHTLCITTSQGDNRIFALEPMPVEIEVAIPFEKDAQHASYDADAVSLFWHALVNTDTILKNFRARFIGKASPVHFFWGAFDLAVTRFSGRIAPKHPGGAPNVAARVMEEAYSHEVSSAGFWPGTGLGEAAYYAYAYPAPAGFSEYPIQLEAAYFHDKLGEFLLPYEAVRRAKNPAKTLLSFLQTTYKAAATLADWDRASLERKTGGTAQGTALEP